MAFAEVTAEAAMSGEATEVPPKKWSMGTTEIIIIVCVAALVLLGIILCILLFYKARLAFFTVTT